jgi:aminoacylase
MNQHFYSLHVDEEEAGIKNLVELIRFQTISGVGPSNGSYDACAHWLQGEIRDIGLDGLILPESEPRKPIVVATWRGSDEDLPSILLNGHYDVVPVIQEHWTVPAFEGTRINSRIYGRGAQDMKCVCAQYLVALRRLKVLGYQPVRTIHLSFVPDEETGGAGMNTMLTSSWYNSINIGLALDEGLASEDNEYCAFYGERLPWWVKVTAEGNTGHGSRFIEGTAVEQVMAVTQRALAFRQQQKDILHGVGHSNHESCSHAVAKKHRVKKKTLGDVTSLNVTMLRAGTQAGGEDVMNVVPARAEVGFDIRVSPHVPPDDIINTLDTWCREISAATPGLPQGSEVGSARSSLRWEFVNGTPLQKHPTTDIFSDDGDAKLWWELFERTLKDDCGIHVNAEVFSGATDSRFLRALRVKAFGFSPMRNSPILLHEHDEYLEEKVFIEGCNVYIALIRNLASQKSFST